MEAEARRYDHVSVNAPEAPKTDGTPSYLPGPMSKEQLVLAANEFVKRCIKAEANEDEECVPTTAKICLPADSNSMLC
jgi:hypothetical protein